MQAPTWEDSEPIEEKKADPNTPSWEDSEPPPSMIESGIHGIVNNVPFGPQIAAKADELLGQGNYSENLANYNKKFEEGKQAHPIPYGIGAVAGAIAPLAIPGVGEAMEAAPVASNAVLGAANALSNEDLTKNLPENLKKAAIGAGVGGLTGGILNKIMPSAKTLENAAASKGLASTGIGSKYLAEMEPKEFQAAKDFVMKNNLIGTNKEEVLQKALSMQKDLGQKIGNIGKELDKAGIKASEDDILEAVGNLQSEAAKTANLENPELRKLSIWHNKGANDIFNKIGDDPSWKSIQELKQAYGKAAFSDTGEVKNEAAKNTYFELRNLLQKMTKKAEESPSLPSEYKEALAGYHTIDPVIDGLRKAVGAERAGTGGHAAGHGFISRLISSLPGQSNPKVNLATAGLATMVSPHLGPLMALPTLTNPAIQSKVFSSAARNLPSVQKGINQLLNDYLVNYFKGK